MTMLLDGSWRHGHERLSSRQSLVDRQAKWETEGKRQQILVRCLEDEAEP